MFSCAHITTIHKRRAITTAIYFMWKAMPNNSKEEAYRDKAQEEPGLSKLWKVGLISASSALLGGVAVAWWHRKTLASLQNPIIQDDLQKSGSSQDGKLEEKYDEE
jgi:hypothetical protein